MTGPRGLPLVGYAPFINKHDPIFAHRGMMKLSEKYGQVVGFYLGPAQPIISVCGDAVREALRNTDLGERPITKAIKDLFTANGKVTGLFFAEGQVFDEQHRFAIRHLIDLAKVGNENVVGQVISDFLFALKVKISSNANSVVNFKRIFNVSIINILWASVAGKRFQLDDSKLDRLIACLEDLFRGGNIFIASIPIPVPVIRLFPYLERLFGISSQIWDPLKQFMQQSIEEHSSSGEDSSGGDFIDSFMRQMASKSEPDSSFNHIQLVASILDIFVSGNDTMSNAIGFALLHLINHQEVQEKVQQELDQICGQQLPTLAHKSEYKIVIF